MNPRHEIQMKLTQFLDGVMLGVIFWLAHTVRFEFGVRTEFLTEIPEFTRFFWLLAVIIPVSPIVLEFQGFYNHPLRKKSGESLWQVTVSLVWLALILGLCVIFLKWSAQSRSVILLFLGLGGVSLLIRDSITRFLAANQLKTGVRRERVALAGASEDMDLILARMPREQRLQIEVVGRVDLANDFLSSLSLLFREKAVERVLFAADHVHFKTVEQAIHVCETEGVEAWLSADFMHPTISRLSVEHFGQSPMLVFRTAPDNGRSMWIKDTIDRVGAAIVLLLTLPLWLFALIGIRLTAPEGPVIFKQVRSGRFGKEFTMFKFRTIHPDAESRRGEFEAEN